MKVDIAVIWRSMLVGCLLYVIVACNASPPIREASAVTITPSLTPTPSFTRSSTSTPTMPAMHFTSTPRQPIVTPTISPPPSPTPPPTIMPSPTLTEAELQAIRYNSWQEVRLLSPGLQVAVPPRWVNLDGLLTGDLASAGIQFWADSKQTGVNFLAEQPIKRGNFLILMPTSLTRIDDPVAGLRTVAGTAQFMRRPILLPAVQSGAYADLLQDPTQLFSHSTEQGLRIRTVLLLSPVDHTPILLMLGASADSWQQAESLFRRMIESIVWQSPPATFLLQGQIEDGDVMAGVVGDGLTDVWSFMGEAGEYAGILLTPTDSHADLTLTLYAPTGRLVQSVNYGLRGEPESLLDTILSEFGEYRIEINDKTGNNSPYQLQLTLTDAPRFDTGGEIQVGENVGGTISDHAYPNWEFTGEAGDVITLILRPETARLDLILYLIAPDGTELVTLDEGFAGDTEALVGFRLPMSGSYVAQVRSFANVPGGYRLSLSAGTDNTVNFYDAGDLAFGDMRSEQLLAHEAQIWFFEGSAKETAVITVFPIDLSMDIEIWLLDSRLQLLKQQDEFGAGEGEQLVYQLPATDEYLIYVQEFFGEAGEYEINLSSPQITRQLLMGDLHSGEIMSATLPANKIGVWQFDGVAGTQVDFRLVSQTRGADFILTIHSPDGVELLRMDDEFAGGLEEIVGWTMPATGRWQLWIEEFFGNAGDYQLQFVQQETPSDDQ